MNWCTLRNSAVSSRRRARVAHLPAGRVERLAEAGDDDAARGEQRRAHHRPVRHPIEHDVLVDLVGQQQHAGLGDDALERREIGVVQHTTGGVVREVDQQQPRPWRDRGADPVPVGRIAARGIERHEHRTPAGEFDRRHVAVVRRLEHDDFVARLNEREHRRHDGLRCACRDRDLGVGVVAVAVQRRVLAGNRRAQRRDARHRRVLVVTAAHGLRQPGLQAVRRS